MGAIKNYLQIECQCTASQMETILKTVAGHINVSQICEIEDFDDVICGVRVCVEFDKYFEKVEIKVSEILDNDYDLLYGDTAVFTSRLREFINEYNRNANEAYLQAMEIQNDRYTYA